MDFITVKADRPQQTIDQVIVDFDGVLIVPLRLVEMSTPMVLRRQLLAVNAEAVKDYAPKKTTMQFVRHCITSRMEKQHSSRTDPKDLSPPYRAWDALVTCT